MPALLYFGVLAILVLIYLGDFPTAFASSKLQNVTVDDTAGSPTGDIHIVYEPPGVWSAGQNCTTCEAKVDKSQVLDGTWHDVSYISDNPPSSPISATLTFDGVAVYAFCVITRAFSDPNGNSDMSFLIDGEHAGSFTLAPNGDTTYQYGVLVYANTSLTPGTHIFTMVVGHSGGSSAVALLDYFMFTQEVGVDASPTPVTGSSPLPTAQTSGGSTAHSSLSTTGDIALAVSLVVVGLFAVAAGVFLCRRRARSARRSRPTHVLLGNIKHEEADADSAQSTTDSTPDSRVAHPFPPSLTSPAQGLARAVNYNWVPAAGAYVATKGAPPVLQGSGTRNQHRWHSEGADHPYNISTSDLSGTPESRASLLEGRVEHPGRIAHRHVQDDQPGGASQGGTKSSSPISVNVKVNVECGCHKAAVNAGDVDSLAVSASGSERTMGTDTNTEDEQPPPYVPKAP